MKNLKLDAPLDDGWVIHVYDRNRRLCCSLDPSHSWAFGTGLGLGLLIAVIGMNLDLTNRSQVPRSTTSSLSSTALERLPQAREFLFWID